MALRDELLKRIDRKRQEIGDLQTRLREATSYLQALEDTLKLLPRDEVSDGAPSRTSVEMLRANSATAKARDAIRKAGKPMHIEELLRALDRPITRTSRAALSGSIAAYVRRGEIFIKTAPNTFSLKELGAPQVADALPDEFGYDDIEDDEANSAEPSVEADSAA